MKHSKTAREVFDAWAQDYHADGMERHHRPRVERALDLIDPPAGDFLEVGVGNGYAIHRMATGPFAGHRCHGLDISPQMIRKAEEKIGNLANVQLHVADFLEWEPPAGAQFSMIFSMEVFYYLPQIQQGIERARTLLQPGGLLAVLVNHYREHEASHAWPDQLDTPMQLWSAREYVAGFEAAGFASVRQQVVADEDRTEPDDPGTLVTWGKAI